MENNFTIEKFTFTSQADGLILHAVCYLPKQPKGIIQFVHGMCEHMGRYEETMSFFAKNGYIACGYDQRGHGESALDEEGLGYFGEDDTAKAIVADAVTFTQLIKEKYPSLPVALYGHSMGSMVVRCYLQEADSEIDKLVVSGSPFDNGVAGLGVLIAKAVGFFKGEKHRSKFLRGLSTGSSEKAFPEDGKKGWLTRDKEVVEKYEKDKYCNYTFTVNGFKNLFWLLKNTYASDLYGLKNPDLPILFVAGSEDPIIGNEKKWLNGQQFLRKVGYTCVEGKLYEEMRHEPHNELGKELVWTDVLAFLQK